MPVLLTRDCQRRLAAGLRDEPRLLRGIAAKAPPIMQKIAATRT